MVSLYLIRTIILFQIIFEASSLLNFLQANEIEAHAMFHQRNIIAHSLSRLEKKEGQFDSFISFNLDYSFELFNFFQDIYDASRISNSSNDRVSPILRNNHNKRYYQELNLSLSAPLPLYHFLNYKFLSSIFYKTRKSISLSIPNVAISQISYVNHFMQKSSQVGIEAMIRKNPKRQINLSLYYDVLDEQLASRSANFIINRKTLYTFEDVEKRSKAIKSDFQILNYFNNFFMLLEIRNLQILESGISSLEGSSPLGHALVGQNYRWNEIAITPYLGSHASKSDQFKKNVYIGSKWGFHKIHSEFSFESSPIDLRIKAGIHYRKFRLEYQFKNFYSAFEGANSPIQHMGTITYLH